MALFYEASTSGLNFDRFTEELFGDSTKLKMKQTYWTAKQIIREKLGKKADEHVLAADAELDLNLRKFHRIRESTKRLLDYEGQLHKEFFDLANLEFDFAELFADCQNEKKHLQRVLQMTANSEALCAKERQNMLRAVVRFFHELDEFYERAVLDCAQSIDAVEKARLEYRGSLLWMKKCSDDLDPNLRDASALEGFRAVQNVVKGNKQHLDLLKADVAVKVDSLQKARKKLFDEMLNDYKSSLLQFYERTANEFGACAEEMSGLESYEIDVLKILYDPIKLAEESQKEDEEKEGNASDDQNWKFSSIERTPKHQLHRRRMESENTESLIELEDVEEVMEVTEPSMDRIRDLLRFDEGEGKADEDFDDERQEVELGMAEPQIGGLNLLKHSNELSSLGLMGFGEAVGSNNEKINAKKRPIKDRGKKSAAPLLEELEEAMAKTNQSNSEGREREKYEKILNFDNILLEAGSSSTSLKKTAKELAEEKKVLLPPKLVPPPPPLVSQTLRKDVDGGEGDSLKKSKGPKGAFLEEAEFEDLLNF